MTYGIAQRVARNRQDLERALSTITSELLKEKRSLCFVDVFMKLGYLSKSDYEHWRFKRVSPLGSCPCSLRLIQQLDKPGTMPSFQHVYEGVLPWYRIFS